MVNNPLWLRIRPVRARGITSLVSSISNGTVACWYAESWKPTELLLTANTTPSFAVNSLHAKKLATNAVDVQSNNRVGRPWCCASASQSHWFNSDDVTYGSANLRNSSSSKRSDSGL